MKLVDFIDLRQKVKDAAGRGDKEITLPVGPLLLLMEAHTNSLQRDVERGKAS